MTEALVNARLADHWQAFSAGTNPAAGVHPLAISALAEVGIQHKGRVKGMDEFLGLDFDLVVTVCDSAAEACPPGFGKGRHIHHDFPDPAKTNRMADFRKIRDEIERFIVPLLKKHQ